MSEDSGWKIRVDQEACLGTGLCVGANPSRFTMGQDGRSMPVSEDCAPEDSVLLAARNCPAEAIEIRDRQTKTTLFPSEPCPEIPQYPFGTATAMEVDPEYAGLRQNQPISRVRLSGGGDAWLVTRYADVRQVLTDQRFSREPVADPEAPRLLPFPLPPDTIVCLDPPRHTRLRSLVAKAFTARRVAALRSETERLVDRLLDEFADEGPPADLVARVALPLPAITLAELTGVAAHNRQSFREWVRELLGVFTTDSGKATAALLNLTQYFGEIVRERRASPTDDLFGELVRAHDAEGDLTDDELIMFGTGLLVAGFEGTADQIADSVYVLLDQREQFDLLARDPSLAESAVEELLRYVPLGTAGVFPYTATEDLELGGTRIRAGDTVMPSILAANHDPAVFDDPGVLDICRKPNPHVAFGHGVHHCVGSQLARMELQVLFAKLPQRFPQLRLAVPADQIPWKSGQLMRGPRELPVAW